MGRVLGPVCRQCRREGIKLFLKKVRCETAKCAMEKEYKNSPPGMHAWRRSKATAYGVRLREKQKVKRYYGVMERQFQRYYQAAEKGSENTGLSLLQLLERRLDNVLFKSGLMGSRRTARQGVAHGHFLLNGRKVDRPSIQLKPGDVVRVRETDRSRAYVKDQLGEDGPSHVQSWLEVDPNKMEVRVLALPTREDVQIPIEEQLIVEFCSR